MTRSVWIESLHWLSLINQIIRWRIIDSTERKNKSETTRFKILFNGARQSTYNIGIFMHGRPRQKKYIYNMKLMGIDLQTVSSPITLKCEFLSFGSAEKFRFLNCFESWIYNTCILVANNKDESRLSLLRPTAMSSLVCGWIFTQVCWNFDCAGIFIGILWKQSWTYIKLCEK